MSVELRSARVVDIGPVTLYRILQLRVEVFVVEQACAYAELDGRDLETGARQLWMERDEQILATLRILDDPDGSARVGRVATAPAARSQGLAGRLMAHAITMIGERRTVLDAQSALAGWYSRFGFEPAGPEFLDDDIPHLPMSRPITRTP